MMDEEIEDDRSARKKVHGQLNKRKKPSLHSLEHRVRRRERQVGEAIKTRVKMT
jgi:transposase InsO family protein